MFINTTVIRAHSTKFPLSGDVTEWPYLLALIISAKTPLAVTSAPAPAPFTTNGCSLYRSV